MELTTEDIEIFNRDFQNKTTCSSSNNPTKDYLYFFL